MSNDFHVPIYGQAVNAVGTIVYGNLEVKEGAMFQSDATNEGNVIQNTGQLATELKKLLGESTLNAHPELQKAIEALRDDNGDALTRKEKLGKVISQLGNNLAYMNNAVGAIQLLAMFSSGL